MDFKQFGFDPTPTTIRERRANGHFGIGKYIGGFGVESWQKYLSDHLNPLKNHLKSEATASTTAVEAVKEITEHQMVINLNAYKIELYKKNLEAQKELNKEAYQQSAKEIDSRKKQKKRQKVSENDPLWKLATTLMSPPTTN